MKVRLGRRVFDAGALPVIAAAGPMPDTEPTPDAVMTAAGVAAAAGADAVEVDGQDAAPTANLVATVRARFPDLLVAVRVAEPGAAQAAVGAGADVLSAAGEAPSWLTDVAAHGGISLVVTSSQSAERAVVAGIRRDLVLVEIPVDASAAVDTAARRLPGLVHAGWPTLVTLPDEKPLAEAVTAAAICAWLGARVFRTTRVSQARQALDMIATLRGDRAPTLGRRGLT